MVSSCLVKVVCLDIKHNFILHYLLATGIVLATPILFGISELNEKMAAQPLEMVSSIIGIVVLTPIFMPEQNKSIYDLVKSKKTSHTLVCFLRLICSAFIAVLLIGILALLMKYNSSDISIRLYMSALSSAFALGSLGLFVSSSGNNVIIGYMVSITYFTMNLFMRNKLNIFDLFTFTDGGNKVNLWLYVFSSVLTILALLNRKCLNK